MNDGYQELGGREEWQLFNERASVLQDKTFVELC